MTTDFLTFSRWSGQSWSLQSITEIPLLTLMCQRWSNLLAVDFFFFQLLLLWHFAGSIARHLLLLSPHRFSAENWILDLSSSYQFQWNRTWRIHGNSCLKPKPAALFYPSKLWRAWDGKSKQTGSTKCGFGVTHRTNAKLYYRGVMRSINESKLTDFRSLCNLWPSCELSVALFSLSLRFSTCLWAVVINSRDSQAHFCG